MEDSELQLSLEALSITRRVLDFAPMVALRRLLDACLDAKHPDVKIRCWSEYATSLLPYGLKLENALRSFLMADENACVKAALAGEEVSPLYMQMLDRELHILEAACGISTSNMRIYIEYGDAVRESFDAYLPSWIDTKPDLADEYKQALSSARENGFGKFRDNHMFVLRHGHIVPVTNPDPITMDQLQGYDWQRKLVLANLQALLRGEPASDMLLYGDSGTGKSSTLKAAANALHTDGLRLVEVRPSQLHHLPMVLERMATNPLRFMIFIDDLSFLTEDQDFRALKGVLEGSVLCRPDNLVVCATSNRRHLIKESFSDREGDDVHANETIQQTAALSDRFGLTIPFMNPKKDIYLQMVAADAKRLGVQMPEEELFAGAERFALQKGGRSGRAAHQYVAQIKGNVLA